MSLHVALGRIRAAGPADVLRRLGKWWLEEFLGLFPARFAEQLYGRGRTLLAISVGDGGTTLALLDGMHAPSTPVYLKQQSDFRAEIDRFLRDAGHDRIDVDIGLRLSDERIFTRQLLLPAEAVGAVDAIATQDLVRKTPFRPEDIYFSQGTPEPIEGNRIRVWQWIVRRQYVHEALLTLGMDIQDLTFVASDKMSERQPAPFINLRSGASSHQHWYRKVMLALCASAIGLSLAAGGVKYWKQQSAMDRLEERIAAVSGKAQQIRLLADQTQQKKNALLQLRLQRSEKPGVIDLWEEMTRVLPSHSWLTELRIGEVGGGREEQIAVSGFSSAAPSLVGIVDSSPLFYDAALTSPIALDATEGRERFSLQAKVKVPASLKEAVR